MRMEINIKTRIKRVEKRGTFSVLKTTTVAAAVSLTFGLWIRNRTPNPSPGPVAAASTCQRTSLPWRATLRAWRGGDSGSYS